MWMQWCYPNCNRGINELKKISSEPFIISNFKMLFSPFYCIDHCWILCSSFNTCRSLQNSNHSCSVYACSWRKEDDVGSFLFLFAFEFGGKEDTEVIYKRVLLRWRKTKLQASPQKFSSCSTKWTKKKIFYTTRLIVQFRNQIFFSVYEIFIL